MQKNKKTLRISCPFSIGSILDSIECSYFQKLQCDRIKWGIFVRYTALCILEIAKIHAKMTPASNPQCMPLWWSHFIDFFSHTTFVLIEGQFNRHHLILSIIQIHQNVKSSISQKCDYFYFFMVVVCLSKEKVYKNSFAKMGNVELYTNFQFW